MRYFTLLFIVMLSACGITLHSYSFKEEKAIAGKRYEGEGFSVLPPDKANWMVGTGREYPDSVGFSLHVSKNGNTLSTLGVGIFPFSANNDAENFERLLKKMRILAQREEKIAKSRKVVVSTITRAGMRCVLVERLEVPKASTDPRFPTYKSFSQNFICERPNQPKDFPPIEIRYHEGLRQDFNSYVNSSEVLAPIWASLQFNPVDRATSKAYQNWLKENARIRQTPGYKRIEKLL